MLLRTQSKRKENATTRFLYARLLKVGRRLVEPLFATNVANALSGRAKFFLLVLHVLNRFFLPSN